MNLICCSKNCRHQKDGYCCLSGMTALTASKEDGCLYYSGPLEGELPSNEAPEAGQPITPVAKEKGSAEL